MKIPSQLMQFLFMGLMVMGGAQALLAAEDAPEIVVKNFAGAEIQSDGVVAFDDMIPRASASQTFTIQNTGTGDLTGLLVKKVIAPYAQEFVLTPPAVTSVAPGGSTTFTLSFSPQSLGQRGVQLLIDSNDADENPFSLNVAGLGIPSPVKVLYASNYVPDGGTVHFYAQGRGGERLEQITLKNESNQLVTGLELNLDGAHPADFSIVQGLVSPSLAPGGSTQITVRFSARELGDRTATLHVSSQRHGNNPHDIVLTGTGVGADIAVESRDLPQPPAGQPYDLRPLRVGMQTSALFYVRNEGFEELTGLNITLSGPGADSGDLYLMPSHNPLATLAPGAGISVQVIAMPRSLGVHTAQINIASNDPDENHIIVPLMCSGTDPALRVETAEGQQIPAGGSFDLGTARVQDLDEPQAVRTLILRNTGVGALRVFNIKTEGPAEPAAGYFNTNFGSTTRWIPEGGSLEVKVRFYPLVPGTRAGTLKITCDAGSTPAYGFGISGTGMQPLAQVVQPDGTVADGTKRQEFGSTVVGLDGQSLTYTVRNIGNLPLTLEARVTGQNGPHFTITTPPASSVEPGESTTLTVQFKPGLATRLDAYLEIRHNQVENPYQSNYPTTLMLRGTGLPIMASFSAPDYTVNHGASTVPVTVKRSHGHLPMKLGLVTLQTVENSRPWFPGALPLLDYTPSTRAQPIPVDFAEGELEKTVTVTLVDTPARSHFNREFFVNLNSAAPVGDPVAGYGTLRTALVRILAPDDVPPVLTLDSPAAGTVKQVLPLLVRGTTSDDKGIDRILVKLNDNEPVLADIGDYGPGQWPVPVRFSVPVYPQNGPNVVVITSYDPRGNSTTVTREFNYTGRWPLTYVTTFRTPSTGSQSLLGGTVTFSAVPATGAWAPSPTPSQVAALRTVGVEPGTVVRLVAQAKPGHVFSRWVKTAGPDVTMEALGETLTFAMPGAEMNISAEFELNAYSTAPAVTNNWHWLLHPEAPSPANVAYEGYLSGTIAPSGSFTGKLLIKGLSVPVVAKILADSPAVFTVAGQKRTSLPFPGGELRLQRTLVNSQIQATVTHTTGGTSTAQGRRAIYDISLKAPPALLNSSATKGSYTMRLGPVDPQPGEAPSPRGSGYATMNLSNTGTLTITGVLADGTAFTQSSALLSDNEAPFFVQLPTPGGTTKLGLATSLLKFDPIADDSDVTGDVRWFRPAAASSRIQLYTAGWPDGISLAARGALYSATQTVQVTIAGAAPPALSPGRLHFSGTSNTYFVLKTNFSIKGNTVIKTAPSDSSYNLVLNPAAGLFSGNFTQEPLIPGVAKPAFRGIILQKGTDRATGFYISTGKAGTPLESGAVKLSAQ